MRLLILSSATSEMLQQQLITPLLALSGVGLAITGAYLLIYHTKKAMVAAGSEGGMDELDSQAERNAEGGFCEACGVWNASWELEQNGGKCTMCGGDEDSDGAGDVLAEEAAAEEEAEPAEEMDHYAYYHHLLDEDEDPDAARKYAEEHGLDVDWERMSRDLIQSVIDRGDVWLADTMCNDGGHDKSQFNWH